MNEGIEASVPLALTLNVCMNVRFWEHIQTKLLFGRTMSHVPTMAARFILLFSKPRAASAFPSRSHTTPDHIVGGRLEPTSCSEKWEGGGVSGFTPRYSVGVFLILAVARFVLVGSCISGQLAHVEWVLRMPAWVFAAWRFWVRCDFLSTADGFFPIQSASIHVIHPAQ